MIKTLTIQDNEGILRAHKKQKTHQDTSKSKLNRIIAQFSTETFKVQKVWDVFQVLRDHACQSRQLYPGQLSYEKLYDGETKILHDKRLMEL